MQEKTKANQVLIKEYSGQTKTTDRLHTWLYDTWKQKEEILIRANFTEAEQEYNHIKSAINVLVENMATH